MKKASWDDPTLFVRQKFTSMQLADGRILRVPESPPPYPPCPENGLFWDSIPAIWLLPPQYQPPEAERPANTAVEPPLTQQPLESLPREPSPGNSPSPLSNEEYLDITTGGPFCPVDWRRRLAGHLVATDEIPNVMLDDDLQLAWFYLQARPRCHTQHDFSWLSHWLRVVARAFKIYEHPRTRMEVEARLLAQEPIDDIARKLAHRSQSIAMFRSLFFDISNKLQAPGWIMHHVIGWHDFAPQDAVEREGRIWKYFGYMGGPSVLDDLIYGFATRTRPKGEDQVNRFYGDTTVATLRRIACVASHLVSVDDKSAMRLLKMGLESRVKRLELAERRHEQRCTEARDRHERAKVQLEIARQSAAAQEARNARREQERIALKEVTQQQREYMTAHWQARYRAERESAAARAAACPLSRLTWASPDASTALSSIDNALKSQNPIESVCEIQPPIADAAGLTCMSLPETLAFSRAGA